MARCVDSRLESATVQGMDFRDRRVCRQLAFEMNIHYEKCLIFEAAFPKAQYQFFDHVIRPPDCIYPQVQGNIFPIPVIYFPFPFEEWFVILLEPLRRQNYWPMCCRVHPRKIQPIFRFTRSKVINVLPKIRQSVCCQCMKKLEPYLHRNIRTRDQIPCFH